MKDNPIEILIKDCGLGPEDQQQLRMLIAALKMILGQYDSYQDVVKSVFDQADSFIKTLVKLCAKDISCKRGCHHCCYQLVGVSKLESMYLADVIKKKNLKIDLERLKKQAKFDDPILFFEGLPFEDKRCIFLNDKNECSIYEDRPLICRTYFVKNDPEFCRLDETIHENAQFHHPTFTKLFFALVLCTGDLGYHLPEGVLKYLGE